jgi:hypothetical protein
VDFNTRHMRLDFKTGRRWAEERQMPEIVPNVDWLQPPREGDRDFKEMPRMYQNSQNRPLHTSATDHVFNRAK